MKISLLFYVCVHMYAGDLRGLKRASDPLELELQVTLSQPLWGLGIELWSSEGIAKTFDL